MTNKLIFLIVVFLLTTCTPRPQAASQIISHIGAPQNLAMFWRDQNNVPLLRLSRLADDVRAHNHKLIFAMNGGMFDATFTPVGLFIEQGVVKKPLNTLSGNGNFYLPPNGVFYITADQQASIAATSDFSAKNVTYATQSGPLLVHHGVINSIFDAQSTNLQIRNGVGVLPNGQVVLAMSREPISFYAFADYFKSLGCTEALYLDGFVSQIYDGQLSPSLGDGRFGVMLGFVE